MSFDLAQPQGSVARYPVCKATLNGSTLPGVISAEVTNNTHFTADTYHLTLAMSALPSGMDAAYFSSSANDQVAITASFADGYQPDQLLIIGQVDDVDVDLVKRTLTLTGRDLSAQMIDTKTSDHFQQNTASEIVAIIAGRHGLQTNIAATTTKAGTYYELYHSRLTVSQTEWDLLIFLAEQEDFDLWVSGNTLNFQPSVAETDPPYVLLWSDLGPGNKSSNCSDLQLKRSQTLAKDIIVKVRSWNQAQGVAFTVESKRNQAAKSQRSGGQAQTYFFRLANATQAQAQQFANNMQEKISRHERVVTAAMPGDNLLTIRKPVKLVGTNTDWDQVYYVDSIHRHISMQGGYRMEVRAKNHSTASMVTE